MSTVPRVESLRPSETLKPEEYEGNYLGGRLKFVTRLNWPIIIFYIVMNFIFIHAMHVAILELLNFRFKTALLGVFFYSTSILGTTVGSHRLWTHKTYKATLLLKIVLMLFQTHALNLVLYKWVLVHKLHHKYTDTDADPHNSKRGFFFSHIGWLLMAPHPMVKEKAKQVDMSDIKSDAVVMFQKKYYVPLFLVVGVVVPLYVPVIFWSESYYVSFMMSFATRFITGNVIASANSVSHFFGTKPYDRNMSAVENSWMVVTTLGEGWHNYHHAFPSDYRASEFNYLNISTKVIDLCAWLGLAYDLKSTSPEMIEKKMLRTGDGSHPNYPAQQLKNNALVPYTLYSTGKTSIASGTISCGKLMLLENQSRSF